jgi:CBS domain containing-hemolysin-like protein
MKSRSVRDKIRPIQSIVSVSESNTVFETLERMKVENTDMVAVHRGSQKALVGYITIFDLLNPNLDSESLIRPLIRDFTKLSPNLSLSQAFRCLRKAPNVPGIVQNSAADALGIIHLRDVAEYIISLD